MKKKTTRINFHKNIRIDKVCSSDDLRPTLQCIYFKDGYMYATDANMLVKLKISECCNLPQELIDKLDDKLLYSSSYVEIIKYDTITDITECGIIVANKYRDTTFKFIEGTFPNSAVVTSKILHTQNSECEPKLYMKPELLLAVSNAMPFDINKKILIERHGSAFVIRRENVESLGIVMGCM